MLTAVEIEDQLRIALASDRPSAIIILKRLIADVSRGDDVIARDLRSACRRLRVTPMPLSELIPLLQRAADALDRKREDG